MSVEHFVAASEHDARHPIICFECRRPIEYQERQENECPDCGRIYEAVSVFRHYPLHQFYIRR